MACPALTVTRAALSVPAPTPNRLTRAETEPTNASPTKLYRIREPRRHRNITRAKTGPLNASPTKQYRIREPSRHRDITRVEPGPSTASPAKPYRIREPCRVARAALAVAMSVPTSSLGFDRHRDVTRAETVSPAKPYQIKERRHITRAALAVAVAPPPPPPSLDFDRLRETVLVDVVRAEGRPIDVRLAKPCRIGDSVVEELGNLAVRVELRNGCVGWGEAAVTAGDEDERRAAIDSAKEACAALVAAGPGTLDWVLERIDCLLPGQRFASVRAGVEMAVIDAVANSLSVPLWRLFGGASNSITTDITIPIVNPDEAAERASAYMKQGFNRIRIELGKDLDTGIHVLKAVKAAHPQCLLNLDANEGYTVSEAVGFLEKLHEIGVKPMLFEQPVERDDWDGLGYVSRLAKSRYGISVSADESCRSLDDARRIINGNLAHIVNIKLAKLGVVGSLEVIKVVRRAGLGLVMGGMVESRLATGFAGQMSAGLGCFGSFDLSSPRLLSEDPVVGGYEVSGAVYKFPNFRGHGGFLHWESIH